MNILAAFIFFTRLPFWRIREVPAECFKHVVPYWPLSGWLTGGVMGGTLVGRTGPPLHRCRIAGTYQPIVDYRRIARRRTGGFL